MVIAYVILIRVEFERIEVLGRVLGAVLVLPQAALDNLV